MVGPGIKMWSNSDFVRTQGLYPFKFRLFWQHLLAKVTKYYLILFGPGGNPKGLTLKKMLKYVPTVGWAWGLSDFIFLDRNWEKDKQTLTKGMSDLATYPSSVWLLLFAEGTRLSPEKLELSQKLSTNRLSRSPESPVTDLASCLDLSVSTPAPQGSM